MTLFEPVRLTSVVAFWEASFQCTINDSWNRSWFEIGNSLPLELEANEQTRLQSSHENGMNKPFCRLALYNY